MQKLRAWSQVKNGLQLAGLTLLFLAVAGVFLAGVLFTFFPGEHSRLLGSILLTVSTTIMVIEMKRWVSRLPAILGLATLNGIIMFSTGHLLNDASVAVSRLDALVTSLFFAAAGMLSVTFKGRTLNTLDRIGLMLFVYDVALLIGRGSTKITPNGRTESLTSFHFLAMGVGLFCLVVPWGYDRVRGHTCCSQAPSFPNRSPHPPK